MREDNNIKNLRRLNTPKLKPKKRFLTCTANTNWSVVATPLITKGCKVK